MSEEQRKAETRALKRLVYSYGAFGAMPMVLAAILLGLVLLDALPFSSQLASTVNWLAAAGGLAMVICVLLPPERLLRIIRARAERVERAPGARLQRLAQLWFSKKVYSRIFVPVLSDLQLEYFEALAEGDRVKARFVLARGYGAFWLAFVAQLPVSLAKVVVELWIVSKG